jgi:hypothetical protein
VEPVAYDADGTMFHETDCEFFQDLVQWCSDPAKDEPALIIGKIKKYIDDSFNIISLVG